MSKKNELPDIPETMEDYMLRQLKKTVILKDGNRKHTANVIRNIIEDYDMMEDVKELVKKMMKLAA